MFRSPRRPGVRICGAHLSGGAGYCRAIAITGRLRCRWHGGRSTGPRTPWGKARAVAAMTAGRARWVERTRREIAMGIRERFPGGRPKKTASSKGMPREISRARAIVAREWAEVPAEPETPWQDQTHAERLNTLTGKSLDVLREV